MSRPIELNDPDTDYIRTLMSNGGSNKNQIWLHNVSLFDMGLLNGFAYSQFVINAIRVYLPIQFSDQPGLDRALFFVEKVVNTGSLLLSIDYVIEKEDAVYLLENHSAHALTKATTKHEFNKILTASVRSFDVFDYGLLLGRINYAKPINFKKDMNKGYVINKARDVSVSSVLSIGPSLTSINNRAAYYEEH